MYLPEGELELRKGDGGDPELLEVMRAKAGDMCWHRLQRPLYLIEGLVTYMFLCVYS